MHCQIQKCALQGTKYQQKVKGSRILFWSSTCCSVDGCQSSKTSTCLWSIVVLLFKKSQFRSYPFSLEHRKRWKIQVKAVWISLRSHRKYSIAIGLDRKQCKLQSLDIHIKRQKSPDIPIPSRIHVRIHPEYAKKMDGLSPHISALATSSRQGTPLVLPQDKKDDKKFHRMVSGLMIKDLNLQVNS